MKYFKLTEDRVLKEIHNWLENADADDLATLTGHMFGGQCVVGEGETDYEFTPMGAVYTGAFGALEEAEERETALDLTKPEHAMAYLCAARVFICDLPGWPAQELRQQLNNSRRDIPEDIVFWQPFEDCKPYEVEQFITDHATDIVASVSDKLREARNCLELVDRRALNNADTVHLIRKTLKNINPTKA